MTDLNIRPAHAEDARQILQFITALAVYEQAPEEVVATEADIRARLFSPDSTVYALMAEVGGQAVGFAIYFLNFSTWTGRHGIHLEDVFISSEWRGRGYATRLLRYLARMAVARDYRRLEWNVLDWNAPAIAFYEAIGATAQSQWIGYRLDGQPLRDLAAGS